MKFFLGACLAALVCASARAGGDDFSFHFPARQPAVYSVEMKINTSTTMSANSRDVNITSKSDVRFKFQLLALGPSSNGIVAVSYKPYDFEGDWDTINASGRILSTLRGYDVRATQNGILLYDSQRGIGMGQADKARRDMINIFLSGTVDFDSSGDFKSAQGDVPFVYFFNDQKKKQEDFFDLVFPRHLIKAGDGWQKVITKNSVGGDIKLDIGLSYTNNYTRAADIMTNGESVATFELASTANVADQTGYYEQPGQNVSLSISQYSHDASGVFHFDTGRGLMVDDESTTKDDFDYAALIQEKSLTGHTIVSDETTLQLLSPGE